MGRHRRSFRYSMTSQISPLEGARTYLFSVLGVTVSVVSGLQKAKIRRTGDVLKCRGQILLADSAAVDEFDE